MSNGFDLMRAVVNDYITIFQWLISLRQVGLVFQVQLALWLITKRLEISGCVFLSKLQISRGVVVVHSMMLGGIINRRRVLFGKYHFISWMESDHLLIGRWWYIVIRQWVRGVNQNEKSHSWSFLSETSKQTLRPFPLQVLTCQKFGGNQYSFC